jgi:hypothetical protein
MSGWSVPDATTRPPNRYSPASVHNNVYAASNNKREADAHPDIGLFVCAAPARQGGGVRGSGHTVRFVFIPIGGI